jgi:hypothetical protein
LRCFFGVAPMERDDVGWQTELKRVSPTLYRHLGSADPKGDLYEPLASHEDTQAGHLENWNRLEPDVWMEILSANCGDRKGINRPFRRGDRVYATTGQYAISLPASFAPACQEREDAPKMEGFFAHLPLDGDWKPLAHLSPLPVKVVDECEGCRGHGYNTLKIGNRLAAGEPCLQCGGAGEIHRHPPASIKRFHGDVLAVSSTVALRFSYLPDPRWNLSVGMDYFLGRFADGHGQLVAAIQKEH